MSPPVDLAYPFTGRWLVQNSPANRMPSHGTEAFASSCAIDFVPVVGNGRTAPFRASSLLRPEPPERFPGFRRQILAPLDGVVVAARDGLPDHHAHRGMPSLSYALTQRRRAGGGWGDLAGNHVFIRQNAVIIALCHLERGSIAVRLGQHVQLGDAIARCGNSGNSTEPHLHVQAMDDARVEHARALPMTFRGELPHNREILDIASPRRPASLPFA